MLSVLINLNGLLSKNLSFLYTRCAGGSDPTAAACLGLVLRILPMLLGDMAVHLATAATLASYRAEAGDPTLSDPARLVRREFAPLLLKKATPRTHPLRVAIRMLHRNVVVIVLCKRE